jgi:CubicO group peptidase (beta-lactamase class C family)
MRMRFYSILVALLLLTFTKGAAHTSNWPLHADENPPRPSDKAYKDLAGKLRKFLEAQRARLHIPGLAFVAVRDDKVIYLDALGLRDVGRQLPVTPDTLFPIGSCTKSFTSVAAAISQDRDILTIDDAPRKYLPYFHMADPEADALITLRDMLCHRTGLLSKADLAAEPGVLSREEYVRAATSAKPTAKFRASFQYSNSMFTAAGEMMARANSTSWERLIENQIFNALGMSSSVSSLEAAEKSPNRALGYVRHESSGEWEQVAPAKSLTAMGPAGGIASTARDMSRWLRCLTGGGRIDGKTIVSKASLAEITRPHMPINDKLSYALGWATYRWNGLAVVEHNGGSNGISAVMSFIPDRHVGFAFLANTSPNDMTVIGKAGRLLWPLLLDVSAPEPTSSIAAPTPAAGAASPPMQALPSADELLARMTAALGGERNLRRHTSIDVHARKRYENQGVQAELLIRGEAPFSQSQTETWTAAGKPIGRLRSFFDGLRGGQETTFGQDATYAGDEIDKARRDSALHEILDVHDLYRETTIERETESNGQKAYVFKLTPKRGSPVILHVSARTALVLERQDGGDTSIFSDYRNVDGEVMPFRTTIHDALGESTVDVQEVRFNGRTPPGEFCATGRVGPGLKKE